MFTALKVATTLATIGAIVGEYFGAPRASLGQYIAQHVVVPQLRAFVGGDRRSPAAIGIGLYVLVVLVERLVMPWHASVRRHEIVRPSGSLD